MDPRRVVPGDNPVGPAVLRGKRPRAWSWPGSWFWTACRRWASIHWPATRASGWRFPDSCFGRAQLGCPACRRWGGAHRAARTTGPARVCASGRCLGLRDRHLRSLRSRSLELT